MSVWHGDSHKKKPSGGRKRAYRKKRRFERGSFSTETTLGERKLKKVRRRGGNLKMRALKENQANVSNPATGKMEKVEIKRVVFIQELFHWNDNLIRRGVPSIVEKDSRVERIDHLKAHSGGYQNDDLSGK